MDKQFARTSASPIIVIDVSGDLRLKGQDDFEVVAKSDSPEDLILQASEDRVEIRSNSSCTIRVPRAALVEIRTTNGDAVVKGLDGNLSIGTMNGELELRNVCMTHINKVNGNLTAKNVDGDLYIDSAEGDVFIRRIQGNFIVNGLVSGNLTLTDIEGNANASSDGNVMLRLDPAPGHEYKINSTGNIFCRLSSDASVEISVPKASQVMVDLPGIHASAPVQTPYALTLGEGDAKITLSAKGNVVLDTHAPEWDMEDFDIDTNAEVEGMADAITEQINQQVDTQVRMMEDQLNAQLSSLTLRLSAAKLTEDQARRIEERARQASERATQRAQDRMRRAQERMEQKMAAAQRKMEYRAQAMERASRHGRPHVAVGGFNVPGVPKPPTPPGEPVKEEERLMILQMLEQKKISMEEAESLLTALEDQA